MIATQYSFTLPADYDMSIIDRRIRDKGPLLDGLPHLALKAYLSARKGEFAESDNLYAPFYLWEDEAGLADFLCSPFFQVLTGSFGWPSVRSWIVWHRRFRGDLGAARFATREIAAIGPHAPLADMRAADTAEVEADVAERGALASAAGFEPTGWTRVRFQLWRDAPDPALTAGSTVYRVGHLSPPR